MPTLIEQLQTTLLTTAPAGGVWCAVNTAQPVAYPFIVHQRVVSEANVSLRGPSLLQNTRVQIDIYARTMAQAVALETAVEAAMLAACDARTIVNVPLSSQDLYEPDPKVFRISKDYSVWSEN